MSCMPCWMSESGASEHIRKHYEITSKRKSLPPFDPDLGAWRPFDHDLGAWKVGHAYAMLLRAMLTWHIDIALNLSTLGS